MQFAVSSFKFSIALCAIQLSGQAELVERCLRNPAVSRCVRPDVFYRDGGKRLVRQHDRTYASIDHRPF